MRCAGTEPHARGRADGVRQLLAPASALDVVAKSQLSLNAKQLRGLESCPGFCSARLKRQQLAKAARRLAARLSLPEARHASAAHRDGWQETQLAPGHRCWAANVVLPAPLRSPQAAGAEPLPGPEALLPKSTLETRECRGRRSPSLLQGFAD